MLSQTQTRLKEKQNNSGTSLTFNHFGKHLFGNYFAITFACSFLTRNCIKFSGRR